MPPTELPPSTRHAACEPELARLCTARASWRMGRRLPPGWPRGEEPCGDIDLSTSHGDSFGMHPHASRWRRQHNRGGHPLIRMDRDRQRDDRYDRPAADARVAVTHKRHDSTRPLHRHPHHARPHPAGPGQLGPRSDRLAAHSHERKTPAAVRPFPDCCAAPARVNRPAADHRSEPSGHPERDDSERPGGAVGARRMPRDGEIPSDAVRITPGASSRRRGSHLSQAYPGCVPGDPLAPTTWL
jgi:hypothetical protein